jgi:hypothetical protein
MSDRTEEAVRALLQYEQADFDGIIVKASRQAIHEVVDALAAAKAKIEQLKAGGCALADALDDFTPSANMESEDGGWWCPSCKVRIGCATYEENCTECGTHLADCQPDEHWIGNAQTALAQWKDTQ